MGDTSVHVCFGYLQGECVPGSLVLYFRKRYDCWLPNIYYISSAIGMATHQEQMTNDNGDGDSGGDNSGDDDDSNRDSGGNSDNDNDNGGGG